MKPNVHEKETSIKVHKAKEYKKIFSSHKLQPNNNNKILLKKTTFKQNKLHNKQVFPSNASFFF